VGRRQIEQRAGAYFDAVDRYDLDGVLAQFARDCVVTMEPAHNVWRGHDGLTEWLTELFATSAGMEHRTLHMSVDELRGRAVAEQSVTVEWTGRPHQVLHNITAVDVGADGLIAAVTFWLGHDERERTG
jgi:hypothetical protein